MPRFFTGDQLGNIKAITCSKSHSDWKLEEQRLHSPSEANEDNAKNYTIQKLAIKREADNFVLFAARSNGRIAVFTEVENEEKKFNFRHEWIESRFAVEHKFVGLDYHARGIFWCTSNGALGRGSLASLDDSSVPFSSSLEKAFLPKRLQSWQLSPDAESFCYGGNEVDLSVWSTDRAFSAGSSSNTITEPIARTEAKKRKLNNDLLPGEVWRAKNLPNDSLNLRQPINITSVVYLSSKQPSTSTAHLITGTQLGDVRRYDTRAARRPVANWVGIGKVGGVGHVQAGLRENELFVSDNGSNLSALDLRNGRVIYSYKEIQGAVTSTALSGDFLASTSQDRFFRLHSTFEPPVTAGKQQEERGEVLGKMYMRSIPTAVVSDPADNHDVKESDEDKLNGEEDEGEDPWEGMRNISDDEGQQPKRMRRRT